MKTVSNIIKYEQDDTNFWWLQDDTNAAAMKSTTATEIDCDKVLGKLTRVHWQPELGLAIVQKIRGNIWRKIGFSVHRDNFLYPEETLWLWEKKQVVVTTSINSLNPSMELGICEKKNLFDILLDSIELALYQAYSKLKTLEFIAFRHSKKIRCFKNDAQVYDYLVHHPDDSLIEALVCFDLFIDKDGFSKAKCKSKEIVPYAYVIVTNGPSLFSAQVILALLEEAEGIPVVVAAVQPSGHVLLQEFTDALRSIDLSNESFLKSYHERKSTTPNKETISSDSKDDIEDLKVVNSDGITIGTKRSRDEDSNEVVDEDFSESDLKNEEEKDCDDDVERKR